MELNKYSKTLTQDTTQPAAQAMLYGIGLTDDDLKKAQVGIASMGYDGNTCNMHLNDLAQIVKKGVETAGPSRSSQPPAPKPPPPVLACPRFILRRCERRDRTRRPPLRQRRAPATRPRHSPRPAPRK